MVFENTGTSNSPFSMKHLGFNTVKLPTLINLKQDYGLNIIDLSSDDFFIRFMTRRSDDKFMDNPPQQELNGASIIFIFLFFIFAISVRVFFSNN